MIVEGAIGDAYGAGFEFAPKNIIDKYNTLANYIPHQLSPEIHKMYTDDTQMTLAIIEMMLDNKEWSDINLANSFVNVFKRNPRKGYASRFYDFLIEINSGEEFLEKIKPTSTKNGACTRAYPIGAYNRIEDVMEKAKIQAKITHDTPEGIASAQAIALISHYFIHYSFQKPEMLLTFINLAFKQIKSEQRFDGKCDGEVEVDGIQTVNAVIKILMNGTSLSQMLYDSVELGGDVDTVASIVCAIGSISNHYKNDLPDVLYNELENDIFGREYLEVTNNLFLKFINKQKGMDKTKTYNGDKLKAIHSFTVMPKDNNYANALFGGKLMYEMDYAGVQVVRRALYGTGADGCVTASVERIDFLKPAFTGDIITMEAEIKSFGKSSIQVRVTVNRESIEGEIEKVCTSNLTFVAVKDKKPFKHNLNFEKLK